MEKAVWTMPVKAFRWHGTFSHQPPWATKFSPATLRWRFIPLRYLLRKTSSSPQLNSGTTRSAKVICPHLLSLMEKFTSTDATSASTASILRVVKRSGAQVINLANTVLWSPKATTFSPSISAGSSSTLDANSKSFELLSEVKLETPSTWGSPGGLRRRTLRPPPKRPQCLSLEIKLTWVNWIAGLGTDSVSTSVSPRI